MWVYFQKDFLVYWRDRKEIVTAFVMPIILIVILGYILTGWIENPSKSIEIKAALVSEDDHQNALNQFEDHTNLSALPQETRNHILEQAAELDSREMLLNLLTDEEISHMIEVVELDKVTAMHQLEAEDLTAVITIPEGYSLALYNKLFLNKGSGAELQLTAVNSGIEINVLHNLIEGLFRSINSEAAISTSAAKQGVHTGTAAGSSDPSVGGLEQIEGLQMITSFQYFTLGITLFFALMISITTASKAVTEKREQVFVRLLLTGARPHSYLFGKAASTFCMSMLQMTVVILLMHFIFQLFPGRDLSFWIGTFMIIMFFCLANAAFSAIFTSLLFKMNDPDVPLGISFILLILCGIVGGSFVPIYAMPEWFTSIGSYTPNGLTLSAMIGLIQTNELSELLQPLFYLGVFSFVIIAVSVWIFPRRGRS